MLLLLLLLLILLVARQAGTCYANFSPTPLAAVDRWFASCAVPLLKPQSLECWRPWVPVPLRLRPRSESSPVSYSSFDCCLYCIGLPNYPAPKLHIFLSPAACV